MSVPTAIDLLLDGFGRVRESVHRVVDGLDLDALTYRPDADANSIAWLVWHLTRIQDDHVAGAFGTSQVWHEDGWYERSGLSFGRGDHGYGHSSSQVASVRLDATFLRGYHNAVHEATVAQVKALQEHDFARIVDRRWNPPVTLAVRLISVIADDLEHVGQAAYVRGLYERM